MNHTSENSDYISHSPSTPSGKEQVDLTFFEALKLILMGKKVHKLDWEDRKYYLQLNGGFLRLHKPDGKWYDFIMSQADLEGTDYIQIF